MIQHYTDSDSQTDAAEYERPSGFCFGLCMNLCCLWCIIQVKGLGPMAGCWLLNNATSVLESDIRNFEYNGKAMNLNMISTFDLIWFDVASGCKGRSGKGVMQVNHSHLSLGARTQKMSLSHYLLIGENFEQIWLLWNSDNRKKLLNKQIFRLLHNWKSRQKQKSSRRSKSKSEPKSKTESKSRTGSENKAESRSETESDSRKDIKDIWAHRISAPETGCLLLSRRSAGEMGFFNDCVILMLRHGKTAAFVTEACWTFEKDISNRRLLHEFRVFQAFFISPLFLKYGLLFLATK